MKKLSKALLLLLVIIIASTSLSLPAAAASSCTLTVKTEDGDKSPINGIEVFICKIASVNGTDYYPAKGFESSGISIAGIVNDPSAANAKSVHGYVKQNNIPTLSLTTASGAAEFTSLNAGIWLVFCGVNGGYSFNPYIVFLPQRVNGTPVYNVTSAPKIETSSLKSIYVIKKWDDNNNSAQKRPDSITVVLKRDGAAVSTAELSHGNGWSHTFERMPHSGKYTVEENPVSNYSAAYSGDSENGFIITNTYNGEKLPQTGQLWWPIAIIAAAGVGFVLLGIIELGARKNEKKHK